MPHSILGILLCICSAKLSNIYYLLTFFQSIRLLVADRQKQVYRFFEFPLKHFFEDTKSLIIRSIEDMTHSQEILQIRVIVLGLKCISEYIYGIIELVLLEQIIDFLYD